MRSHGIPLPGDLADYGFAAEAVVQLYPPNGGYPGSKLAVRITGRVFPNQTASDVTNRVRVGAARAPSIPRYSSGTQVGTNR